MFEHRSRFVHSLGRGERDDSLKGTGVGTDGVVVENHMRAIRVDAEPGPLAARWLGGEFLAAATVAFAAVWLGGIAGFACVVVVIARLHRSLAEQRRLATVDGPTGALNRRAFTEAAARERRRAARSGAPLSLAYLDLDGLKEVNDRRGHRAGDRMLRDAALAIASAVRLTDVVGRVGGDEFAVLLPGADALDAAAVAQRLRRAVAASCADASITASVGVATFRFPPESVEDMLAAADRLMYRSKAAGGNRITGAVIPFHVIRWGHRTVHVLPEMADAQSPVQVPLK
jgi:diguanylate cyclase (GGDEF)-like protein